MVLFVLFLPSKNNIENITHVALLCGVDFSFIYLTHLTVISLDSLAPPFNLKVGRRASKHV